MSTKNLTRHKQIIIRVTPEEKEFIMKKVAKSGCRTVNLYALYMMTVGSINNIDLTHYHELANEINKIGVNINQIAHIINSTNRVFDWEIKQLQERMDEIWQLLKSNLSEVQSTSR